MMHVFYGRSDLNGLCSGAIARYFLEDRLNMVGLFDGDKLDLSIINSEDSAFITSISFSDQQMLSLKNKVQDLVWITHDKRAIERSIQHEYDSMLGLRDPSIAGCHLTWNYLTGEKLPKAVEYISLYTQKQRQNPEVVHFYVGLNDELTFPSLSVTKELWSRLFNNDERLIRDIILQGSAIERHNRKMNDRVLRTMSFEVFFEGLRFLAVNRSHINQNFFQDQDLDLKKYHGFCSFSFRGEQWSISLYTFRNDVNLQRISVKYNGQGHPKAVGFQMTTAQMEKDFFPNSRPITQ